MNQALLNLTLPSPEELDKLTCDHKNSVYHPSIEIGFCYDCNQEVTWDELNHPFCACGNQSLENINVCGECL